MSPDRLPPHAPRRWAFRSSWGELAFAGLLVAAASGVALALPYDIEHPFDSLALLLLTNPGGAFLRNLHYWTGQAFLVLTVAHTWSHLARWTETRMPRRMWWRTTASLPLSAFVMLSGFMLKGDAEAQQAIRIVGALLEQVPWVGGLVSLALVGTDGHRQILYVHHIATATALIWVFVAEHARAAWPRLVAAVEVLAPAALISVFASPALHDGLDPVVKGPWYFLGLQEALHWVRWPAAIVVVGALLTAAVVVLPRLPDRRARAAKAGLAAALVVYALLSIVGVFFRGANWALAPAAMPWQTSQDTRSSGLVIHGVGVWGASASDAALRGGVPQVMGRREGCLVCHKGTSGLSRSHSAEAVGCASCHGGNPFSSHKATAHAGLMLVPGNLASADRACGTVACHPSQVERVSRSLMTTMAGIVSVDRSVWGTRGDDAQPAHVMSLGTTGVDSHLRQLCASCHLGAAKSGLGPVGEDSRGGGCNACHLKYGEEARAGLARYQRELAAVRAGRGTGAPTVPRVHPDVSIAIGSDACFGCHSRSGRISTSYEGWHEVGDDAGENGREGVERRLADGRLFTFVAADVHARSMTCIDCHTAREVMGDGVVRSRAHEQVRVACEDCHRRPGASEAPTESATVIELESLDAESRRIADLRGRNRPRDRFLATANGREPLLNTGLDDQGPWLAAKASGRRLPLKPPAAVCLASPGHARLSCVSCHTAWAPRCPTCHTAFDAGRDAVDLLDGRLVRGAWVETGGGFRAVPPTLGIRVTREGRVTRETVDTFIPGMVLSIDRNQAAGGKPDSVFRRLYARSFSHTIGKSARSCQSCHVAPVALGYGEGTLRFERAETQGRWRFEPRNAPGPDGLPADAWVGFLQERTAWTSTRTDVRPFTVEEQQRILTVGACLTCHEAEPGATASAARTGLWKQDFRSALSRLSSKCVLPKW
jgi:hypothetical protein